MRIHIHVTFIYMMHTYIHTQADRKSEKAPKQEDEIEAQLQATIASLSRPTKGIYANNMYNNIVCMYAYMRMCAYVCV